MENTVTESNSDIATKDAHIYSGGKSTQEENEKAGFWKLFACKCPRCRLGNMFETSNPWRLKTTMKMNKHCPVCGQPLDIEVGFYYGSSYISYALSIAFCVASLLL